MQCSAVQCSAVPYIAVQCSAIQLSEVSKRLCYNWEMNGDSHETKAAERGDTGAVVETVKWPLYTGAATGSV